MDRQVGLVKDLSGNDGMNQSEFGAVDSVIILNKVRKPTVGLKVQLLKE